jgi:hypothetical protein
LWKPSEVPIYVTKPIITVLRNAPPAATLVLSRYRIIREGTWSSVALNGVETEGPIAAPNAKLPQIDAHVGDWTDRLIDKARSRFIQRLPMHAPTQVGPAAGLWGSIFAHL